MEMLIYRLESADEVYGTANLWYATFEGLVDNAVTLGKLNKLVDCLCCSIGFDLKVKFQLS